MRHRIKRYRGLCWGCFKVFNPSVLVEVIVGPSRRVLHCGRRLVKPPAQKES